ncbi:hypothetical protein LSH36_374g04021 [Paralvinella palmiformis]|uniref:Uncharacterized protein n=1 Tax=Paralvinella palmiformis TaxID=53620 RepID=A0AAD9JF20_9ANNE|nr:hypothetical protein LSH36_374g04021 [Paralvinella palmiformis]
MARTVKKMQKCTHAYDLRRRMSLRAAHKKKPILVHKTKRCKYLAAAVEEKESSDKMLSIRLGSNRQRSPGQVLSGRKCCVDHLLH